MFIALTTQPEGFGHDAIYKPELKGWRTRIARA